MTKIYTELDQKLIFKSDYYTQIEIELSESLVYVDFKQELLEFIKDFLIMNFYF